MVKEAVKASIAWEERCEGTEPGFLGTMYECVCSYDIVCVCFREMNETEQVQRMSSKEASGRHSGSREWLLLHMKTTLETSKPPLCAVCFQIARSGVGMQRAAVSKAFLLSLPTPYTPGDPNVLPPRLRTSNEDLRTIVRTCDDSSDVLLWLNQDV